MPITKDKRLLNLDPNKCFVCQEHPNTHEVNRQSETFKVCDNCASLIKHEVETRNRIKASLYLNDTRHIFQYTLGADLLPTRLTIKKI
jgi:hypothetical protein